MIGVRPPWSAVLAVVVAAALSAGAGPASAAAPNPCASERISSTLVASASRRGVIDLHFFGAGGAPVDFFECVGDRAQPLGERASRPGVITDLWAATGWRCERLTRRFAADRAAARRLARARSRQRPHGLLRASLRARRSRAAWPPGGWPRVRIADRWGIGGVRTRLCVTSPRRRPRLSPRRLPARHRAPRAASAPPRAGSGASSCASRACASAPPRSPSACGPRRAGRRRRRCSRPATRRSAASTASCPTSSATRRPSSATSRPGIAISQADEWQAIAVEQVERLRPQRDRHVDRRQRGLADARRRRRACTSAATSRGSTSTRAALRASMLTYRKAARARLLADAAGAARRAPRADLRRRQPRDPARRAGAEGRARRCAWTGCSRRTATATSCATTAASVRVREPDGIHLNVAGTRSRRARWPGRCAGADAALPAHDPLAVALHPIAAVGERDVAPPGAAAHRVADAAAEERRVARVDGVVARAPGEVVAAAAIGQAIVAVRADQAVVAGLALEAVGAGSAEQAVRAAAAAQPVVARLAVEAVVAGEPAQQVVAGATEDDVGPRRAADRVRGGAAGDRGDAQRAAGPERRRRRAAAASTVYERVAGEASSLPARSIARTCRRRAAGARAGRAAPGRSRGRCTADSRDRAGGTRSASPARWRRTRSGRASPARTVPAGPEAIVVSGGVESST